MFAAIVLTVLGVFAQAVFEPVPGLLLMEALELPGGNIANGIALDPALAALGKDWKYRDKPKRQTGRKLASEAELAERLMPMYPSIIRLAQQLAVDCGNECWTAMVERKLGNKDVLRISFLGRSRDTLKVNLIAFDQGGQAARRWRREMLRDLQQEATYFVTDNGAYRVRRLGRVFRIEEIR